MLPFFSQISSGCRVVPHSGQGVFQRYKLSRRDGLHWSFARCAQMPDAESLARWEKLRTAQLERMRAKAEKQAAEK